jgi:peptidoglycan hydrolase-like protein with peptidoglycan-binding domain
MTISAIAARTLVSNNSRGGAVCELQQALADAGFDPGPIDGDFGPQTRAAVMRFQEARGLDVDGGVGPQTWGALQGAGPAAPVAAPAPSGFGQPQLSIGSRGGAVSALQQQLAAAGFDPGGVDGDFGPMTRAAVLRFQSANGLDVDGVVGPQTWGALGGSSFTRGPGPVRGPAPANGDFRERILALAQGEVGTREATGNNDGDVTKYPNAFGRGQESYCADFASWVLTNAGGSLNDPWCPSIKNRLINTGNWKGRTDPQPGDLVLFDWDGDNVADHVGLVKSVNGNGTITTIEGNTGGPGGEGVWEKTRGWDFIMGFGNPI